MRVSMRATWVLFVGLLISQLSVAATTVIEQTFESAPHQVVQQATVDVLAAIETGDLDPDKDAQAFVDKLTDILDPVVAFEFIARGVMGSYAKKVDKSQVKQFSEAFKLGLVNTYGKGLSGFGDLEITVLPPKEDIANKKRVIVTQELKGAASTNTVAYTMQKNKKGQWKMTNIVLNGVNLGQTFRSQFASEVKQNKGDVTKTINEWGKG